MFTKLHSACRDRKFGSIIDEITAKTNISVERTDNDTESFVLIIKNAQCRTQLDKLYELKDFNHNEYINIKNLCHYVRALEVGQCYYMIISTVKPELLKGFIKNVEIEVYFEIYNQQETINYYRFKDVEHITDIYPCITIRRIKLDRYIMDISDSKFYLDLADMLVFLYTLLVNKIPIVAP